MSGVGEAVDAKDHLYLASIVFEHSSDGILITDASAVIISVNPAFTRVTGYRPHEVVGKTPRVLRSGKQPSAFYYHMWRSLQEKGSWQGEVWNRHKNGDAYLEFLRITTIKDRTGSVLYYMAVFADITEREQLRNELLQTAKIQRELLPKPLQDARITLKSIYRPYRYVSGDLYGYKWTRDKNKLFGFLIDVMGHGVATALQTSALRILFRQAFESSHSLAERLAYINHEAMCLFTDDAFAAAICFEIDFTAQTLTYASAGITYFLAYTDQVEGLIKASGMFLGIMDGVQYEQHVLPFASGDRFFFLTDGLFDMLPLSFAGEGKGSFGHTVEMLERMAYSNECTDDASAICLQIR
ncbi:PAS domain S-box-containing protein [Aneurinibacillus soli]|uniref:Nitrogen fixation regulatory protein n=1 Tax=Aneurinibacillus soli TaxID=1500254 RepID=A0A0U5B7P5_9BACL|nr:PP2C family protein-serine/threonine phosphatase [Aneurinibacillus soli]PYE60892.1 PAS domain S-box-containing protein [Aneurinibacillus soli]BAU26797.1 Nitrogen fixation regulatory protein [Aneurinibacillus soli]